MAQNALTSILDSILIRNRIYLNIQSKLEQELTVFSDCFTCCFARFRFVAVDLAKSVMASCTDSRSSSLSEKGNHNHQDQDVSPIIF